MYNKLKKKKNRVITNLSYLSEPLSKLLWSNLNVFADYYWTQASTIMLICPG